MNSLIIKKNVNEILVRNTITDVRYEIINFLVTSLLYNIALKITQQIVHHA